MHRYTRGCVVARAGRFAVVYEHGPAGLSLMPIMAPHCAYAHDVLLELSDLAACGAPLAHAVIRPKPQSPVPDAGFVVVGEVPGVTMCRVMQGLIRAAIEAAVVAKWAGDKEHRERARVMCEKDLT